MHAQQSACPVCDARESALVSRIDRRGAPLVTLLCESYGHVFNDPIPSADELAAFYAKAYRVSYKGAAQPRGRQIARNFGRVEKFWARWGHLVRNHPRILDVGAGSGEFLFFAQSLGYDAAGVEPNVDYATFCRDALGLPVRTASIEDLNADASTYDFVRLNHVLEHLRDPVEALERIAARLSPGGVLYVEVPDVRAYAGSKSKGGMFHYGHISNFSAWTLRAAAGRAGLVELAETAPAMKAGTSAFFRKGEPWGAEQAINRKNAAQVRMALEAHAQTPFSQGAKLARLWSKGAGAFASARIAISLREPRSIGSHYLKRLPVATLAPRRACALTPSRT